MVAILYNDRHDERWHPLMEELERQQIKTFQIFKPVIEGAESIMHCINLSHKQIIRWAQKEGLPSITVFEDDIMIPAIDGFAHYISRTPHDYDIYLGGCYNFQLKEGNEVDKFTATHCYTVHKRFYETYLNCPDKIHIDTALDYLGKYILCYPMIALQRKGWSENNIEIVDHNVNLKEQDIYL